MLRRILIYISIIVVALVAWLLLSEWRPDSVERTTYEACGVELPDTLTLVSWNIGYAGLGEAMDFFYDGGERVRDTPEQSDENLRAIIAQLQELSYADFVLLQEVDICSKRSYGVDQARAISEALEGYRHSAFALNYHSKFVPIPIWEPMGAVRSGLLTLSKYPLIEAVRRQYPTIPSLPNRLFDLKRCMLSVGIKIAGGHTLVVNNTHNTAFDSGGMRLREMEFIGEFIERTPRSITAGDWNSAPPGYTPSQESMSNAYFSPLPLSEDELPRGAGVAADGSTPSVRYLDAPYVEGESTTTLVDFAILGSRCTILSCKTLDLGFVNSDHNPIIVEFLYQ